MAEVNERDDDDTGGSEDEDFFQVGNFESEEDAEVASRALRDAGIWFKSERIAVDSTGRDEGPLTDCTFIDVRFEDLERALEVVEAAFDEAEQ